MPPASLPAVSSVRPNPPSTLPDASNGTNVFFCAAVPKFTIGDVPSVVCAEIVIECDASTRAISSIAMMKLMMSRPAPPSSSAHGMPSRPSSPMRLTVSHGKSCDASNCFAMGATSSRAKARTISRTARCCSVK